jgi:hypothetical protein
MIHSFVYCVRKFSQNTTVGHLYWFGIERFLLCHCVSCDEHILAHETFNYYLQNFSEGTQENLEISQSDTVARHPLF